MEGGREEGRLYISMSMCVCVANISSRKKKKATENTKRKKESVLKSYDALVVCMYDYLDSQSVELYRGRERERHTHTGAVC